MSEIVPRYKYKICEECKGVGCVAFRGWGTYHVDRRSGHLCMACLKKLGLLYEPEQTTAQKNIRELSQYERTELRRKNRQQYAVELAKQVELLVDYDYMTHGISEEAFLRYCGSTAQKFIENLFGIWGSWLSKPASLPPDFPDADDLPLFDEVKNAGRIPMLLVVPHGLLSFAKLLELAPGRASGGVERVPRDLAIRNDEFQTLLHSPYLIFDIHKNGPEDGHRLVLEEGIALITQFPEIAKTWNEGHIYCTGSRYGDESTPGIFWDSYGSPNRFVFRFTSDHRGLAINKWQPACTKRVAWIEGNLTVFDRYYTATFFKSREPLVVDVPSTLSLVLEQIRAKESESKKK